MQVRMFERRNNMAHNSKRPNFASGSLDFLPLPLYSPQNLNPNQSTPLLFFYIPFYLFAAFSLLSDLYAFSSFPIVRFLFVPNRSLSSLHRILQISSISCRFIGFVRSHRFLVVSSVPDQI
ncbi:expressed protein [Arabidopsis lyrata subsp. lyrata]|uniref:Expressed protein n=1 Tax=Arabidopsis lyrata subsp. lyrata TaxID=81972 RepID=D7LE29_ARALL|nr:expressed protein [Arabidopsis lyrata subsp. lyrata]